ncbi:MAG: SDR family oxidoreductase [Bacteroidales bacterium]|nr:SDR family oxidoreductase [Bacteroidales bacterium]
MKRILVVGGASGIGLAIAEEMALRDSTEKVYVVDKAYFQEQYSHPKIDFFQFDLTSLDYSFFDRFEDINALMITAGFGRLALFKDVSEQHIIELFNVNTIPVLRLVRRFYEKIEGNDNFYCGVMDSIAGWMSSPFFAVYGATKAALKIFIESVNVELLKAGTTNRILNVSPGTIKGTGFYAGKTDLNELHELTVDIIDHLEKKDDLFIPKYDEIYKTVLQRYQENFREEGVHSYEYKQNSIR